MPSISHLPNAVSASSARAVRAFVPRANAAGRHDLRNSHSHRTSEGESDGRTYNGASDRPADLSAVRTAPGAGTGKHWLWVTQPALPPDDPDPIGARSTRCTLRPADASSYAQARPMMPPPMTTVVSSAIRPRWRRSGRPWYALRVALR